MKKALAAFARNTVFANIMLVMIFIAGIMQGSHLAEVLHHQGYRGQLKGLLARQLPEAQIYDPLADHQDSLEYDDERGRDVFLGHNRMCGEVDVVVAFVPEASMGTAIEMWEAHRHGRYVVASSPFVSVMPQTTLGSPMRYWNHRLVPVGTPAGQVPPMVRLPEPSAASAKSVVGGKGWIVPPK